MIYYKEWMPYEKKILGKRKKIDNNIYTFDIETTSYFILDGIQHNSIDYDSLNEDERKRAIPMSTMYIWMLGINDTVYYGRTWDELEEFLLIIRNYTPEKKIIYIHNLAFEFQFLYSRFRVSNVFARKSQDRKSVV